MLVSLIKGNKINRLVLPHKVVGNYWITDTLDSSENKLISIEAMNGKWCLISNEEVSVIENNEEKKYTYLQEYAFYLLKVKQTNTYLLLYCSPVYDSTYCKYSINNNQEITIGNSSNNYIYYNNSGIDEVHAKIIYNSKRFTLIDNNSRLGVYVNNKRIYKTKYLINGDVIFIAGLKIIVSIEDNIPILLVNNPDELVKCRLNEIKLDNIHKNNYELDIDEYLDETSDKKIYKKNDYIYKKYRSKEIVKNFDVELDSLPKDSDRELSYRLILGPMITLFIISITIGVISVSNGLKKDSLESELPLILISIIMLISVFIWPLIIKFYDNRRREKREEEYVKYLELNKHNITLKMEEQKQILTNNISSLSECEQIILEKKHNLWERKRTDEDFLTISLGLGSLPANISIKYPKNNYFINEELYNVINELGEDKLIIGSAPISISLKEKRLLSLIGNKKLNRHYMEQLLLQLITFHSYDDLKIVLLTDEDKDEKWSYLKILPHCWSNDKKIRFYASSNDEIKEICNYLNNVDKENTNYIIVTDNILKLKKYRFINEIIKDNNYQNINLIMLDDNMTNIPKECNSFIRVSDKDSLYYENNLNGINIKFNIDFTARINMHECCRRLANIPVALDNYSLPKNYSLLQMFEVGKVEQLNIYSRWHNNRVDSSINTNIGIDNYGDLINFNLQDKKQASHSLIIGLPGSGKTNFIITYILSTCINYHPKDAQFVILENNNELNNIFNRDNKLPHLLGLFNYDPSELKRFMISFKTELTRRRNLFIRAEKQFNQSNIDIYKYNELYKNRQVDCSLSHIFVIIDEYDKLEQIHPKFIDKLLKISHIGPMLGVHFLFTIDKQNIVDNRYMDIFGSKVLMYDLDIINNPGSFYLKENNSDLLLGKCADGSNIYNPLLKYNEQLDTSIQFVNNTGKIIKSIDSINNNSIDNGNEIDNIIKYLSFVARDENIMIEPLCLDKLNSYVTVATIMKNYEVNPKKYVVEPVIGEYEDLTNHIHNVLRISLSNNNSIIHSIDINEYENIISSMLFSSMYLYTPEEVNYYIIDMEENKLMSFKQCPLVGEIITSKQIDKIDGLFELVSYKIEERKKLFIEYENDYSYYCQNNENSIPLIVIVINNINKLININSNYLNNLFDLLNCNYDYGIRFVVSTNEELSENISNKFNQYYALKQKSNIDYNNIFNADITNYPEDTLGRGLTKINGNICEFQTAFVSPKNKNCHEFIQSQCEECSKEYDNEIKIVPMMPERITFKQVKHELGKSREMIIGYNTQKGIIKHDFHRHCVNIISGENINNISKFVHPLIKQFAYLNKTDVFVFDALNMDIAHNINNLKYINSDFDENFELLADYIKNIYSLYKENAYDECDINRHRVIFIYGLSELRNKLNIDNKERLGKLIKRVSKLDIFNFIIIDTANKIKNFESEIWYQEVVDNTNGIWVGKGLSNQDILDCNTCLDNDIKDNYCYVIQSGIPIVTQYVESFDILDN